MYKETPKDIVYVNSKSEKWKNLIYKGIKTDYRISNLGRVKNNITGNILKQFIQNNGYYGFTISIDKNLHSMKTARMVALHFIERKDKNKNQVNHINGKHKWDNSVENLEWMTAKENKNDGIKQGLFTPLSGEKNPNSIYTNNQINNVCKLLEENKLQVSEIESITGVKVCTIADIYWGARWKSVSSKYNVKNYTLLPKNSNQAYSKNQIIEVCELLEKGLSTKQIVEKTDASYDCVKKIRAGRTYKDIASNYNIKRIRKSVRKLV